MSDQTDTLLTADYADTAEATEKARIADEPEISQLVGTLLTAPESQPSGGLPTWFQEAQTQAWQEFAAMPMPARPEQAWRFASRGKIKLEVYNAASPVDGATADGLIGRSSGNERTAGKMVFANDTLLDRRLFSNDLAAQGVIWKPLEAAITEHPDLFKKHFMAQDAVLGSQKFAALHRARVRTGTFLYVPKNVEVALPLEVFHWLSGEGSSTFPHTLVIAEAGSKVTLVDYFQSDRPEEAGFACAVNDLIVGPGAKLTYLCSQNWGGKVVSFQINSTTVERDATALSLHLNLGSTYARLESLRRLTGAGGRSDMLSATDDAEANSMPGLEILADEVRCTHGATSGHVDDEELFYLLSRGIGRKAAQELIVHGFLNEVLERLQDENATPKLGELLAEKFARMKRCGARLGDA